MYYSTIGLLAAMVLLIINYDILSNRGDTLQDEAWKVYRRFLFTVLAYYVTDILWGLLESWKIAPLLFADTTVYFVAMASGVYFWAQYTVKYLRDETAVGRFLLHAGRIISWLIIIVAVVNIFWPILFIVDDNCNYHALGARYILLLMQIMFLILISTHAALIAVHGKEDKGKYLALVFFGLIMAFFLSIQLWFPYHPIYTIAYMLGTCLLHTFVINNEKESYRRRLQESYEKEKRSGTVFAHIAMSLARGYTDLFYVNMESGEYTEYHTDDEIGMLTQARHGMDFFESCKREVKLFVHQDDQDTFIKAMNRQFLTETLDHNKVFEMIYQRIQDGDPFYVRMRVSRMQDDNRFIVIGVSNIDEQMKQRLTENRLKEERAIYKRIHALTGNFIAIYMVDPETESFREVASVNHFEENFGQPKKGDNFFETARKSARKHNYYKDVNLFVSVFTKVNVLAEIEHRGIFALRYRLNMNGNPNYVDLKATLVEEEGRQQLIVGINDVDAQVRQEDEYGRRLAQAQKQANIDALTGLKNRHAYLELESYMNRQISKHRQPPFSIVMMDVNDLKLINDTAGHQAGDQYLCDACKTMSDIFRHSPLFRIGGDEFVVISQGKDYSCVDDLCRQLADYNAEASRTGKPVIAYGMSRFEDDGSISSVFERADHSMYENKKALKAVSSN